MKNYYTYILLIFVAVFVITAVFLVPEEFSNEPPLYVYVEDAGPFNDVIQKQLQGQENHHVASREGIIQKMAGNRSSVGLVISMENNIMIYEFITQGYESEKLMGIMEAHVMGWAAMEAGYPINSTITRLENDNPYIPVNKGMLPVFLVMESAFMGLFMVAAYIFQDKEDGTIRAYAVSPASMWQYLLSKVLVFVLFGWVSGLLATIFIMGPAIQYFPFMLLLTSASIFGTVLGLLVSGLFSSFTKAMTGIFSLVLILGVTVISYYMPAFSPIYVRVLPTYPMLFAFREVLFPTGNPVLVYTNVLGYLSASVVLFLIAVKFHEKKIA